MNKKFVVIIAVVVIILLLGGGYAVMSNKKGPTPTPTPEGQQTVSDLSPAAIGLKLVLRPDKKAIKFVASKLDGIKQLEWEFYYDADVPASERLEGEAMSKVTQSFGGEIKLKSGQSTYQSEYRELGTCSAKCRFDTGVEEVKILMKVTKNDGSLYQVEDSISL